VRITRWALLFVAATSVAQVNYSVIENTRVPVNSYVGDEVEIRLVVRITSELPEPLSDPAFVPQPTWGVIKSVRVIPRGDDYAIRIVVVPFEPGTVVLPTIPVGGIELAGLSIIVSSILSPDNEELRPAYGPQSLPGTSAIMLVIAIAVALAVAGPLYVLGPGRRHIQAIIDRYNARRPFRRLTSDLNAIYAQIPATTARIFYTDLISALQRYMGGMLKRSCDSATSSELAALLPALAAACSAEEAAARPLTGMLGLADKAKFAGAPIKRTVRKAHVRVVRTVAEQLETSRRLFGRRRARMVPEDTEEAVNAGD
jgi:hypothetical protein